MDLEGSTESRPTSHTPSDDHAPTLRSVFDPLHGLQHAARRHHERLRRRTATECDRLLHAALLRQRFELLRRELRRCTTEHGGAVELDRGVLRTGRRLLRTRAELRAVI